MTGRDCLFQGGPKDHAREWVNDQVRTVSFAPQVPLPAAGVLKDVEPTCERPPVHTYRRSEAATHLFIYDGLDGQPRRRITFTQYVRPHGNRRALTMEVPHDVADKADQLRERHLVLECEVLTTGEVSLTITDQEQEHDVDIRVVPNGPAVPDAVYDLVRRFDLEGFKR